MGGGNLHLLHRGRRLLSIAWIVITHHGVVSQRWHLGMTRRVAIHHGHSMGSEWDRRECVRISARSLTRVKLLCLLGPATNT